ncbi:MAG: hypothetical protein GXY06_00950 [Clostridiaceae bacterium]|nr:hypothetical protein [Clostridiaceae bacterium]
MASDRINIILEAESRAQNIDLQAKQKADQIIAAAGEAAAEDYESRISQMNDSIRDDLAAFAEQDQLYLAEASHAAEVEANALRKRVEPKINIAARRVADILSGKG